MQPAEAVCQAANFWKLIPVAICTKLPRTVHTAFRGFGPAAALQALCGEGGCQPRLRVPGGHTSDQAKAKALCRVHGLGLQDFSKQELLVDVWMDSGTGSASDTYGIAVQSNHLHVTAGSFQAPLLEQGGSRCIAVIRSCGFLA